MKYFIGTAVAFLFITLTVTYSYQLFQPAHFDTIIRGGLIYDGTGDPPRVADIGLIADSIATIGDLASAEAREEIDARGLAVAPGFINMLSWADGTLLKDGASMSDIKQGVTLEVFGEGWSPGPIKRQRKVKSDTLWITLGEFLDHLVRRGVSCNVASFIGATTVRIHEMDYVNRKPSQQELTRMKNLVRVAMEEGAMGLGSSLGYTPAAFASTEELIELSKVVSQYGGMYITHLRSEADYVLEAVDETIRIAKEANVPAEIYHLKINIDRNWKKIDTLLYKIDSARELGVKLTANMYPYVASGTGLSSRLPTWVQEGGAKEMRKKLRDPAIRQKVLYEMSVGIPYKNSDPRNVMLVGFRLDSLSALYRGKFLTEVARMHGKSPDETVIDLILKDRTRIEALYFLQSEANVIRILEKPYVSIGSDAGSFDLRDSLNLPDHPRAFGTFARVLGRYARDQKIISVEEAIRRMTSLPASNLKLVRRGLVKPGYFADLVVFSPETIIDKATFESPHRYSEGMIHVFVNGIPVLKNGIHTNARPGRVIRGPGYKKPL